MCEFWTDLVIRLEATFVHLTKDCFSEMKHTAFDFDILKHCLESISYGVLEIRHEEFSSQL